MKFREVPSKVLNLTRCFAVYFDVGVTGDSLELTFSLVGDSTSRQWNILVTQLACTDPWRWVAAVVIILI